MRNPLAIGLAPAARALLATALREDAVRRDVTTLALVPPSARARARVVARAPCVICGTTLARAAFRAVDPRLRVRIRRPDGAHVRAGEPILELAGPARGLLTAERTALNFLQRLSGIATARMKRLGLLL